MTNFEFETSIEVDSSTISISDCSKNKVIQNTQEVYFDTWYYSRNGKKNSKLGLVKDFVWFLFFVHSYRDGAMTGEVLQHFGLWSSNREGSLLCRTCFDTGPRFTRSQPKDCSIYLPLTTSLAYWEPIEKGGGVGYGYCNNN